MATPNPAATADEMDVQAEASSPPRRVVQADPELEQELIRAMEEFERGEYIELTVEQLERCAATGEPLWPEESRG